MMQKKNLGSVFIRFFFLIALFIKKNVLLSLLNHVKGLFYYL